MMHGFLGYNATFMLDVVVCALVLLVPALAYSIYRVRATRSYALHRRLQLILAAILLAAVAAFEADMQWIHGGWRNVVTGARPTISAADLNFVQTVLRVHLLFAVSTPLLWGLTIALALARFDSPPRPSAHSPLHRWLGWASAIDLTLTSVTGLVFYYSAFVVR